MDTKTYWLNTAYANIEMIAQHNVPIDSLKMFSCDIFSSLKKILK